MQFFLVMAIFVLLYTFDIAFLPTYAVQRGWTSRKFLTVIITLSIVACLLILMIMLFTTGG
jgi:hypothetical protein